MSGGDWYRPSDDTFLLAEVLGDASGSSALEIGTGSGYIAALLEQRFGRVVATDISAGAIGQTMKRTKKTEFVCCDSASAVSNIKFDLIVMNPPYLPSDRGSDPAVDGGAGGTEVTLRMVRDSVRLLGREGRMLIVTSSVADHQELVSRIRKMNLSTRIAGRKQLEFEELMVIEAAFTTRAAQRHQNPAGGNPSRP